MAQTPASIAAAGANTQTNTINVGPTTINAPGADPNAIANAVHSNMNDHLTGAINHMADGVSH
jgi:hypothetical protein